MMLLRVIAGAGALGLLVAGDPILSPQVPTVRHPVSTVAGLPAPSASIAGRIRSVTDGASATDCTVGGGSFRVLCIDNGSAWQWVGAATHAASHAQGQADALSGTIAVSITGTAAAFAANGTNCDLGFAARGTDAAGNAEECFAPAGGGGSPGGSGTELQYRAGVSTFGAVTGSSISGADVTLGGTIAVPLSPVYTTPAYRIGTNSGLAQEAADGPVRFWINGTERMRIYSDKVMFQGGGQSGFPTARTCDPGQSGACYVLNDGDNDTGIGLGSTSDSGNLLAGGASVLNWKRVASQNTATISGALALTPQAAPPVTCGDPSTQGVIYDDDSVALCWCDGTAWQKLSGAGTCA